MSYRHLKTNLSAGHNEGVIGTLEYDVSGVSNGLSTTSHPFAPKYYITGGYGRNSDVIDSVWGQN